MSNYSQMPNSYITNPNSNSQYLPPAYPNQYMQPVEEHMGQSQIPSDHNAAMNGYAYNMNIPTFSAAAVASGVPPLPIFQGWNQDAMPLPPYIASQNGTQFSGYVGNSQSQSQQQSQQYYPSQPSYQEQYSTPSQPYEQDLSEGEFDDNLGVSAGTRPAASSYGEFPTVQSQGHDRNGYTDVTQRAVFFKPPEGVTRQSHHANTYTNPIRDQSQKRGQQSEPYMPSTSLSLSSKIERPSGTQIQSAYAPGLPTKLVSSIGNQHGLSKKSKSQSEASMDANNYPTSQNKEQPVQQLNIPSPGTQPTSANAVQPPSGKSVAESRRRAREAILNLWSYDVDFQTYVDEGIREDLVGALFDELKLPRTTHLPSAGNEQVISLPTEDALSSHSSRGRPDHGNVIPNGTSKGAETSFATQDVVRHVPLHFNEFQAMETTLPPRPAEPVKTSVLSAPVRSISMVEKDKALKSKMDALRKSREDRAQKAAAKITSILPVLNEQAKAVEPAVKGGNNIAVTDTNLLSRKSPITKSESVHLVESPKSKVSPETPPKVTDIQSQLPAIPGLFLASTVASPITHALPQTMPQPTDHNNVRKRPVAADFDDLLPSVATPKRPFGQSRHEKPLVINVSDDEDDDDEFGSADEDVAMDLDSVADDSVALPTRKNSNQQVNNVQNQPLAETILQPKQWSPLALSSPASTPPLLQQTSRAVLGRPEILQRKESEIEELKKKIAEAEAKSKRNKAKQGPSGNRTPRASEAVAKDIQASPLVDDSAASVQMQQQLIGACGTNVQQIQAEDHVTKDTKVVEIKRASTEQKRLRLEKIASDLAALNASEEQNRVILDQKKAELAKIEADHRQAVEDKQKMLEEMRLLDQEGDDETHVPEVNSIQDGKSDHFTNEVKPNFESPKSVPPARAIAAIRHEPTLPETKYEDIHLAATVSSTMSSNEPEGSGNGNATMSKQDSKVRESATGNETMSSNGNSSLALPNPLSPTLVAASRLDECKDDLSTNQALEAALQEAVRIEADSHAQKEADADMEVCVTASPIRTDQDPPSGNVETSGNVLNSPEYTPELDRVIPDMLDRESDDYEPPEATPPVEEADAYIAADAASANEFSALDSPPFSPAPPALASELTEVALPDVELVQTSTTNKPEQPQDDVRNGGTLPSTMSPHLIRAPAEEDFSAQLFTPYESPLKRFRAYRFHPQFGQEIPGGLKSLTYSHKINPDKEFCRFELAGGICNDSTCNLQHFRDIGLPDDAILTALGSPDEFHGEQRDRFIAGLKGVLLKLRLNKVRDFDMIASEIIAHRVKFLGDKTKVLPLEGTHI